MIISGDEGLDELSLAGGNDVAHLREGKVEMLRVSAADAGLPSSPLEAIRGDDATYNAASLKELLTGTQSAYRDAVLFNAAGSLIVAGKAQDWPEGVSIAAEALDSGSAHNLLKRWIALAQ